MQSKKTTTIVLPLMPKFILLAAVMRNHWTDMIFSGQDTLAGHIERLFSMKGPHDLILLLPVIAHNKRDATRKALCEFLGRGARIWWVCEESARTVQDVCRQLPGVDLVCHASLFAKLPKELGGPVSKFAEVDEFLKLHQDLHDYLSYAANLSAFHTYHPVHVMEACEQLKNIARQTFKLDDLDEIEEKAFQHFRDSDSPYFAGESAPIRTLRKRILHIAPSDLNVLILGETGTGKEVAAFYLHQFSDRRGKPFVALNCAGLSESLLGSELFGHEKGAFTDATKKKEGLLALGNGGTVFLDEVGEIPLSIQAALLRVLQSRRFRPVGGTVEQTTDIRLISATQPSLKQKLASGAFREDLYYRLCEVGIETPKLSDVREDLFPLIKGMLNRWAAKTGETGRVGKVMSYFHAAEKTMFGHPWPGNVRELASLVKRKWYLDDDVVVELRQLSERAHLDQLYAADRFKNPDDILPIDQVERLYATEVHRRYDLSLPELARNLGRSQNNVKKLLTKTSDILSIDEVVRRYAAAVQKRFPELTKTELAKRLGKVAATVRKIRAPK